MHVILVAGYAGSGKTEIAKALARHFRWPLIDKDTITRPLLELATETMCGDPHDRHSDAYLKQIRPFEYRCLMDTIWEIVEHSSSVVGTAPFLREVADRDWCDDLDLVADLAGATVHWVWVQAEVPTMLDRLTGRRAGRDGWKLAHWPEYCESLDLDLRPPGPHHLVDNGHESSISRASSRLIAALESSGL